MSTQSLLSGRDSPSYQTVEKDGSSAASTKKMERLRAVFRRKKIDEEQYVPLPVGDEQPEGEDFLVEESEEVEPAFSWAEYFVFTLIGVAMLWAWNMFLAAAPYFQQRFEGNDWIEHNFQSAILSASTVTNLSILVILTYLQQSASYTLRVSTALVINIGVFTLLTVSTSWFLGASPAAYFVFVLLMVAGSSWATALIQNGAFAFAASFGRAEYTQALMAGQGLAGVLPAVAQMASVLALPPDDVNEQQRSDGGPGIPPPPSPPDATGSSAFLYFLTAVLVSVAAFSAFLPLVRRQRALAESRRAAAAAARMADSIHSTPSLEQHQHQQEAERAVVSIPALAAKLRWPAAAVFTCFAVTMFYPVFTVKILSVRGLLADTTPDAVPVPPLFQPAAFIPLAFFCWNLGDLLGRLATALPCIPCLENAVRLRHRPGLLLAFAVARAVFLPLYLLCNVGGRGAVVPSDAFYLLLVQLPFGFSNGWVGASSMMAAGEWVNETEREVAGGFMGLCLVSGLAVGSLLSFSAAGV